MFSYALLRIGPESRRLVPTPVADRLSFGSSSEPHESVAGLVELVVSATEIILRQFLALQGSPALFLDNAQLQRLPHFGSFSGTVLASMDVKNSYGGALNNASEFNKRVRLLFIAAGTAEDSRLKAAHHAREEFEKGGIKYVWYESPGPAHEWLTWRRDLNEFAPRLFRD